jgi:hypothetical protein
MTRCRPDREFEYIERAFKRLSIGVPFHACDHLHPDLSRITAPRRGGIVDDHGAVRGRRRLLVCMNARPQPFSRKCSRLHRAGRRCSRVRSGDADLPQAVARTPDRERRAGTVETLLEAIDESALQRVHPKAMTVAVTWQASRRSCGPKGQGRRGDATHRRADDRRHDHRAAPIDAGDSSGIISSCAGERCRRVVTLESTERRRRTSRQQTITRPPTGAILWLQVAANLRTVSTRLNQRTPMKRALTSIAAAALLAGVPLLASAHDDDDRGRGSYGHGRHYHDHDWKRSKHVHHYYHHDRHYHVPPRVVHHHHHDHGPRIIERPVYVPVAPPPHVSVRVPLPHADVGFRLFF